MIGTKNDNRDTLNISVVDHTKEEQQCDQFLTCEEVDLFTDCGSTLDFHGTGALESPQKLAFPRLVSPPSRHKSRRTPSPSGFFRSPIARSSRDKISTKLPILLSPPLPKHSLVDKPSVLTNVTSSPSSKSAGNSECQEVKAECSTGTSLNAVTTQPESFVSFAHTLSPLIELKPFDAASPIDLRLSPFSNMTPPSSTSPFRLSTPCDSTYSNNSQLSLSLTKLLPPFEISPLGYNLETECGDIPEDEDESSPSAILSEDRIFTQQQQRKVCQKLDFSEETLFSNENMEEQHEEGIGLSSSYMSLPNIKASTKASPGGKQRDQMGKNSTIKLHLLHPGETAMSKVQDMKFINENLRCSSAKKSHSDRKANDNKSKVKRLSLSASSSKENQKPDAKRKYETPARLVADSLNKQSHFNSSTPSSSKQLFQHQNSFAYLNEIPVNSNSKYNLPLYCYSTPSDRKKQRVKKVSLDLHPNSNNSKYSTKKKKTSSTKKSTNLKTPSKANIKSSPVSLGITASAISPINSENLNNNVLFPSTATSAKKKNPCNCKKSKCLKLYCECFASGGYCDENCNCQDCSNTELSNETRREAVKMTLERNPDAFKSKINGRGLNNEPRQHHHSNASNMLHKTGCHCKKSACLKKYCECYQAGVLCGGNCKCIDCKNHLGSHELTIALRKSATPSSKYERQTKKSCVESTSVRNDPNISSIISRHNMRTPTFHGSNNLHQATVTYQIHERNHMFLQNVSNAIAVNAAMKKQYNAASNKQNNSSVKSKDKCGSLKITSVFPLFEISAPPLKLEVGNDIFSFLSNADLYNASLVNKLWSGFALSEDHWDYSKQPKK